MELLHSTDALDPRIWLNLALGQMPPLLSRWVLIALVSEHEVLPWAMATAVALMTEDEGVELFPHVMGSAVDLTDVDAYLDAVDEVAEQVLDASAASRLRAAAHECIASSPDQQARITARVITD